MGYTDKFSRGWNDMAHTCAIISQQDVLFPNLEPFSIVSFKSGRNTRLCERSLVECNDDEARAASVGDE